TDFDLGLIEPAAMLGRGMERQTIQKIAGMLGREGLVERAGRVSVEVVLHQADPLSFRGALLNELAHALRIVRFVRGALPATWRQPAKGSPMTTRWAVPWRSYS